MRSNKALAVASPYVFILCVKELGPTNGLLSRSKISSILTISAIDLIVINSNTNQKIDDKPKNKLPLL